MRSAIKVSNAIWITIFGLAVIVTGLCFVRVYGELEFAFATLKIMLIVGINIMALVITCGGAPNGEGPIGFRYWRHRKLCCFSACLFFADSP